MAVDGVIEAQQMSGDHRIASIAVPDIFKCKPLHLTTLETELTEVMVRMLPLQNIPFIIGQRAKEGVIRAYGTRRRGKPLNQLHDALPVSHKVSRCA